MKAEEAIEIARGVALTEGWPWEAPFHARRQRAFLVFGGVRWHVMSSAQARGGNVNVHVDDRTGAVLVKAFARR